MRLFDLAPAETTGGDEWRTPQSLFDDWHSRFGFTVDAASTSENAKLPRRFEDGLTASWAAERVWCNPPYSDPAAWCQKAAWAVRDGCPLAVLLLPVDTSTAWFHDLVWAVAVVEFIRGRVTFVGAPSQPRFASMLAIYRP